MAADPKYGTFYGTTKSGKPVSADVYYSDVAGAHLTFDSGAGASSSSDTNKSFAEDVILTDFSLDAGAAGTYACTNFRVIMNGTPTDNVIRVKNHLNTLNNRPPIRLKMRKGTTISGIQAA